MDLSRTFGANAASYSSAVYERCVSTLQRSLAKNPGGSGNHTSLRQQVTMYSRLFDSSPTQQLAYHTIIGQVSRHRLAWHTTANNVIENVPVPTWWYRFVQDAIRSILLTGCAFYRTVVRKDMVIPEIADPCMVLPQWNKRARVWEADMPGWKGIFYEPPINEWHVDGHGTNTVILRCAAARAFKATLRLVTLQDNWATRDGTNSKPSVFTTITSDLASQNGSERQWFKNLSNPDILQTRAVDIDNNFSTLVHKRADTIMKLDAQTHLMREKSASRASGEDACDTPAQMHREHMITDGRSYTEARPLSSLPDTKIIMDELTHSVFFAFGVPPQCLGKNINSERLASSNRLTEMAINSFQILVEDIRRQLQTPIKEATLSKKGSYLGFGLVLDEHELNQLLPVLNTSDAATMIARTFRIPQKMIDKKRVAEQQLVDETTGKKPRTEEQAIAASRQKANQPDA